MYLWQEPTWCHVYGDGACSGWYSDLSAVCEGGNVGGKGAQADRNVAQHAVWRESTSGCSGRDGNQNPTLPGNKLWRRAAVRSMNLRALGHPQ